MLTSAVQTDRGGRLPKIIEIGELGKCLPSRSPGKIEDLCRLDAVADATGNENSGELKNKNKNEVWEKSISSCGHLHL